MVMMMMMTKNVRQANHIQSDDDNEDTWRRVSWRAAANKKRLEFNNDEGFAVWRGSQYDDDGDDYHENDGDDDDDYNFRGKQEEIRIQLWWTYPWMDMRVGVVP